MLAARAHCVGMLSQHSGALAKLNLRRLFKGSWVFSLFYPSFTNDIVKLGKGHGEYGMDTPWIQHAVLIIAQVF
jgi:hypothetical protein